MKTQKFESSSLISSLWIFVLFNMTFRDFHQFVNEGYIEGMMNSTVTEPELLFFALVLEIPIAMIVLSKVLKPVANKWANCLAVFVMSAGILSVLPEADMDDLFFSAMEILGLVFILIKAWKLPQVK